MAYKTQFQTTVVGSYTESEYMLAYYTGKMILFVHRVLWDLDIPQEAATLLYEDNNACTAMANAQKPTPCTCNMDIKYFSLLEWVERDLMDRYVYQSCQTFHEGSQNYSVSSSR